MKRRLPAAIADGLVLALTALAGAVFVVPRLGFYSDDWVLVGQFSLTPDQSIGELFASSYESHFASRPIQGLYSAILYRMFGLQPFGYHVVNHLVIAGVVVLLYGVLRALGTSRLAALGAALVYATLPAFSTARFWFAVFAAPLSLLLYLVSLRLDIAAAPRSGWPLAVGRIASLATLATGLLAYEIVLPLAFASPFIARAADWQARGRRWSWGRWAAWVVPTVVLLVGLALYKAEASGRLGALDTEPARVAQITGALFRLDSRDGDYGLNVPRALAVNFGDHVLKLPLHAWGLRARVPGPVLPVTAIAMALLLSAYLRHVGRTEAATLTEAARLLAAGLVVFGLGYAIFLTNTAIQITPTGVGNRTAMAAGLGVALSVAGSLGLLVSMAGVQWRAALFSIAIAAYASCGTIVVGEIASYWGESYPRQQAIVATIQETLPALPPRTTLFLGGACPYIGPAIVFESSWDLAYALRIAYRDPTVSADVVSPSFTPEPTNITTALYGEVYDWPYGPQTRLLDLRRRRVFELTDQAAALDALRTARLPPRDCPPAKEGVGVPVFR
jgi:hypothetical protein